MRLSVSALPLHGLKLVERHPMGDSRGYLVRMFCSDELALAGWDAPVAQVNLTLTSDLGTVRGMHFQYPPHAELKLVSCIKGEVWDVVVDLRADSSTFLHWHAERLSENNKRALLIPRGFAHGFQTLTADVKLLYFHSAPYKESAEGGLHPLDPLLRLKWPLPIAKMSQRDEQRSLLNSDFNGITL
jgi:dTDP-4-dehydrorhamnose 3,5-epimerase